MKIHKLAEVFTKSSFRGFYFAAVFSYFFTLENNNDSIILM